MDLQGSRTLITGGAGLIGSHIADALLAHGVERVVIFDNFTRGRLANLAQSAADPRLNIQEGDVRDRAALAKAMRGIDVVFHQAAVRVTQCTEDPRLAIDVLATGSFNVFEAGAAARVRKIVAASSASIYGTAECFPTDETHHPYNDRTLYGAAKSFNEGVLRSFNETLGLPYVALRYFNVYGPRMDVHGVYTEVLIRWMDRIAAGEAPLIFGDGSQTMDMVYVEDVARANVLAAESDATDQSLNVASGEETSLNELATVLLRVMGSSLQPSYRPARNAVNVLRRKAAIARAEKQLGFVAQIPLEEGLRRLVAWWLDQKELEKTVSA